MQDYSIQSSDYMAMKPYWEKVNTIMGGTDAMRLAKEKFLPKFPNENQADYDFRIKNAKFTNVFRDIAENLAAKPFSKEVQVSVEDTKDDQGRKIKGELPEKIAAFVEDVDGRGSHIHKFAAGLFFGGLVNSFEWVLVDYTADANATRTVESQKRAGVRPYFLHIPAHRVMAAYSATINGKEQFTHVRIKEDVVEIVNGEEVTKERIRVLNRIQTNTEGQITWGGAEWAVYEKVVKAGTIGTVSTTREASWQLVNSGPISIGVIPLVAFITGRRIESSWRFHPCLVDAADLQIELFQQESGLKYAREATAFPMLAGNGVEPPVDAEGKPLAVPVGPKTVLYAPPNGEGNHGAWAFVEPDATALKFLSDEIKETINQLRELGRQPLTAQTGNLTVVTTAFAADKANSVVQALALNLKDTLENALVYAGMWDKWGVEPTVTVDTDFDVGMGDDKGPATLGEARRNGDLSRETYWGELKRRGILSDEFNAEDEAQRLLDEQPSDTEAEMLDAAGNPIELDEEETANSEKAKADATVAAVQSALQEVIVGIKEGLAA